jgi:hypothetical protein
MAAPDSAQPDSAGSDHPIADLVHQLLDAVQAVVAEARDSSSTASAGSLRPGPAEFCYELDSVISHYLDHNELSPSQYDHIQQQVVNTLAHHLSEDSSHPDGLLSLDHHGNADMADVFSLLDHHVSADLHYGGHDLAQEFHGDPGSHGFAAG